MSFQQSQLTKSVNQAQDIFDEYIYRPTNLDTLKDILSDGYFAQSRFINTKGWFGSLLTFYVDGNLYNAKIGVDNVTLLSGGGGGSFAIGPIPNEFRAATRVGAIALLTAQSAAFPVWLSNYDSAPLGGDSNAPLNVRVFYADGNVNYMDLMARDNGSWVVNQSFDGVVGPEGPIGPEGDGNVSSFPSLDRMNEYFLGHDKFKEIMSEDNATVTIDGVVFQFRWEGASNPQAYDPDLWVRAEIGTTAGSLIMGPSSIESAAESLMYKSATGLTNFIIQSEFDETGSKTPVYYDVAPEIIFDLALVKTDVLPAPIKSEAVMEFQSISDAFICIPAEEGTLTYKTWIGTESSHADQPILSESLTITAGMVGIETKLNIKNPVIINTGENIYSETSGVSLMGGLQTEGPMSGQVAPFIKLHLQQITPLNLAMEKVVEGIKVNTAATPNLIQVNTVINGVTRTQNINKVTSVNAGLMIPADKEKLDNLTPGVGGDTVGVTADDTDPGFLSEKLTVGSGLSLSVVGAGGNETLNIDLEAIAGSDILVQLQMPGTKSSPTTLAGDVTINPVPLDTVLDPDGIFVSNKFIAPRAGYYLISFSTYIQLGIGSEASITFGDGSQGFSWEMAQSVDGASPRQIYATKIIHMAEGAELVAAITTIIPDDIVITLWSEGGNDGIYAAYLGAQLSGGGDGKVKVDALDAETGYLADKIVAGDNVAINILNVGGVEQIEISSDQNPVDIGGIVIGDITRQGLYFNTPAGIDYAIPQAEILGDGTHGVPYFYNTTDAPQNPVVVQAVETDAFVAGFNTAYANDHDYVGDYHVKYVTIQVADVSLGRELTVTFSHIKADFSRVESISEKGAQTVSGAHLTLKLLETVVVPSGTDIRTAVQIEMTDSSGTNVSVMGTSGRSPYVKIEEDATADAKVNLATETYVNDQIAAIPDPSGVMILNFHTDNTIAPLSEEMVIVPALHLEPGKYKYEAGFTLASPNYLRWGQLELVVNTATPAIAATSIIDSGESARSYASASTMYYFDVPAGGADIQVKLNCVAYTDVDSRNVYVYLTKTS